MSGEFVRTGSVCPNPAILTNTSHCFLATNVRFVSDQNLDDTEEIEVILMPLPEVIELVKAGGFRQSLNVSVLFFALAKLGYVA